MGFVIHRAFAAIKQDASRIAGPLLPLQGRDAAARTVAHEGKSGMVSLARRLLVQASVCRASKQGPNQALEPTSRTVMPRATLLISECSNRSARRSGARGTPVRAVAHL